ncbi:MAG TPA: TIGR03618 family F420-dependent PPOX class oxidoreductase [Frankiaceae bacterium]|jgi:PPOX class probable F420-dependent enzyme|nr:TIGR03618 family F420-dependent PPOX class oxidoreductase [Frankiaceae bacterium]
MTTLEAVDALAREDHGLAVVSTLRAAGTIHSSLVNAAVMTHPLQPASTVVGFVTYGKVKLANLRARPQLTVTFRSGWRWASVEGTAEIIGPDDPHAEVDAERLRLLLREVFQAAGGSHDDWAEYDRVMREQGRTAVFLTPTRTYGV